MSLTGFMTNYSYSDAQPMTEQDHALYTPLPLSSTFAAVTAAGAIAAALAVRERDGLGQRIVVPLHSATFAAFGFFMAHAVETGPVAMRFRFPNSMRVRCGDGRYVQLQGSKERLVARILEAIGRPEWVPDAVHAMSNGITREDYDTWCSRLQEAFAIKTAIDWEDTINAAGGVCTVVRTVDEFLGSDYAQEAGLVADVPDDDLGLMRQPGTAVKLTHSPGRIRGGAPPLREATNQAPEFSHRMSRSVGDRGAARAVKSPLAGVRVLDLCHVLAGPMCGRTLAEYGAEVVKIDDPVLGSRDATLLHVDVNRGKRSILLDLRRPDAQQVMWRLIDTADVLLENYRDGRLAALGFGYEAVAARRPNLVYASLNAFGYGGRWSARGGYDQNAQALTGVEARRGGRESMPRIVTYPVNDYITGLLGAYGVMLALRSAALRGSGERVTTSLAQSCNLVQSRYAFDYNGYSRNEPEGQDVMGESALSRLYEDANLEWFYFLADRDGDWDRLTAINDFGFLCADERFQNADSRHRNDDALAAQLQEVFSGGSRARWIGDLCAHGLLAVPRLLLADLRTDDHLRELGLLVRTELPGLGLFEHVGSATASLSLTPQIAGRPFATAGLDTEDVLREIGCDASLIAEILRQSKLELRPV
jgi:crotonobetainyl-CoA:carnitine CoA-transferase CaiB-like acyl-CoA transferase